jgi:S-DNA-T family DNA segregation ATPase FtsK/SpoIIIE
MAVKRESGRTGWRETWGIVLFCLGVLLLFSVFSYSPQDISFNQEPPQSPPINWIGPLGAWSAYFLFMLLGVTTYLFPAALLTASAVMLFQREGRIRSRMFSLAGMLIALSWLAGLAPGVWSALCSRLVLNGPGGLIGYGIGEALIAELLGKIGSGILGVCLFILCLVFLLRMSPMEAARRLFQAGTAVAERIGAWRISRMERNEQIEEERRQLAKQTRRLERVLERERNEEIPAASLPVQEPEPRAPKPAPEPTGIVPPKPPVRTRKPPESKEPPALEIAPQIPPHRAKDASSWKLPPLTLLDDLPPESQREIKTDHLMDGSRILTETLSEFGIEAKVTNVETGPVVTRYELLPAAGVRVERISGLSSNIALSMKAVSVRVQAPIPGKGVVGIEVPNPKTTLVFLREILESAAWTAKDYAIPLALGKDVGGREVVADLADMPHLLVAGATGSGKTVCMNSLLCGLLMTRSPDELRLMLVDPKIVEFSAFANLPHLVVPVITDAKKVALGLRWAINEMEKRYKMFARVGVRNIKAFNSRPIVRQGSLFDDTAPPDPTPDKLPYIVVVVDELADLMLVARAEIETSIARLAQLSRAVGIHMILATQRPSVNVITGTIKANFPARIAFQVAQKVDSRTILDDNGADKLLGRGDMLFLPPGTGRLIRAQGCLTLDHEVKKIVQFLCEQGEPQYEIAIKEKIEQKTTDLPDMEEDEGLIESALEIIRQTKRASTSSLQRRLRIGYTRAARIMDLLEERGVVGPAQGSDPREILIDLDGDIPQNEPQAETPKAGDPET